MIDKTTINLIQSVLDGEATSEEVTHLDQIINNDEEVRFLHSSMKSMVDHLENVNQVEPSPFLAGRIQSAVKSHTNVSERIISPNKIYQFINSMFNPKIGVSFATGLAAGLMLFAITSNDLDINNSIDPSLMSGTIINTQQSAVERVEFESGYLEFSNKITDDEHIIVLKGNLLSETSITFDFLPDQFSFTGINGFENTVGTVSHSGNDIVITGNGQFDLIVTFVKLPSQDGSIGYNIKYDNEIQSGTLSFK